MKPALITTIIPSLLGFLGTAALGWHLATPPLIRAKAEPESTGTALRDHRRPTKSPRDVSLVAGQMRAVRNAGSP